VNSNGEYSAISVLESQVGLAAHLSAGVTLRNTKVIS
jgi:hypothetical protein